MTQKLPPAIKKVRGTDRPDKRPADAPELDVGEPPMPRDLTEREIEVWRLRVADLKMMGVLTPADGLALKQLVCTEVQVDKLKAMVVGSEVKTVISTQKEPVDRVNVLYDKWLAERAELRRLWTLFGLDPLARTAVHTVNPAPRSKTAAAGAKTDGNQGAKPQQPKAGSPAASYFQH